MERFVCELKWQSRLSWIVATLMFVAITVFGAPAMTIAYVIAGELIFFTTAENWYRRRRTRH
jgi:hypothetical protein